MLGWSSLVNFARSIFTGNNPNNIEAKKRPSSTRAQKALKLKCSKNTSLNDPSNSCKSLKSGGRASSRIRLSGRVKKTTSTFSSSSNKLSANKNLIKNCNIAICNTKSNGCKNNNKKISATSISSLESNLLIITNLDYGIEDSDLIKLFKDIGPLKTVAVHRDRYGKSMGSAYVLFQNKADATKALKKYNGWNLLGKSVNIEYCSSKLSNEGDTDMYCVEPKLNLNAKQVGSSRKYNKLTEQHSLKSKKLSTASGRSNDRETFDWNGYFEDDDDANSLTNKEFYELYKRFCGNKEIIFE